MNYRMGALVRVVIGTVLGTIAAIAVLKYADSVIPVAEPSHLYQLGTNVWAASLPYWALSGFAIGLCGGLISLGSLDNSAQLGFSCILSTVIVTAMILTYQVLAPDSLTLGNFFQLSAFNILFYALMAVFPAFFGVLIGSAIASVIRPRRSTREIMPEEMKVEQAKRDQEREMQRMR